MFSRHQVARFHYSDQLLVVSRIRPLQHRLSHHNHHVFIIINHRIHTLKLPEALTTYERLHKWPNSCIYILNWFGLFKFHCLHLPSISPDSTNIAILMHWFSYLRQSNNCFDVVYVNEIKICVRIATFEHTYYIFTCNIFTCNNNIVYFVMFFIVSAHAFLFISANAFCVLNTCAVNSLTIFPFLLSWLNFCLSVCSLTST